MTWPAIAVLALGAYGFKALGLVVIGGGRLPSGLRGCLALIPPAMLGALVVTNTFGLGDRLVVDARAAGVGAAALATWRGLPFPVVILLAAAVTAVLRAV